MKHLTPTERKILRVFSTHDFSAGEVAEHLKCSKRTIDFHMSNIYGKLGVKTRSGAVAKALKLQLV